MFLEPAEWDDEVQGSRPVIQLDVSIEHYIGESPTIGPIAVSRSSQPCMSYYPTLSAIFSAHQSCIVGTVHWSVSKSTADPNVVCQNIAGARKRSSFPLFLPRGVALRQMEQFWHELQFNPVEPVEVPFKADLFRRAPKDLRVLRRLAHKGRKRLERAMRKQNGKPKLVLGVPNDAQTVAPLLALAHGPGLAQTASRGNLNTVDNTTTANLSENQKKTTRNAKKKRTAVPIVTSSWPSWTTKRTAQVHAVPKARPFSQDTNATGGGDFIPETKSVNSEKILSEDER